MRYSKQRETIFKIISSTDTHPTAEQVYKKAKKVIKHISLSTVYRNLIQLENNGTIRSIKDGDIIRYDGNLQRHDHLFCTRCNMLYDVDILPAAIIRKVKTQHDFDVHYSSLIVEGICNKH